MAAGSLLALLDDIATVLDDVAVLTKVAARKTAGVLGDDLALNAQQVAGVAAHRELPVVGRVALGSILNKAILVPAALAISAFAPWAVTPLLMFGGAFLCYEGFEKLAHRYLHSRAEDEAHHAELIQAVSNENIDIVAFERDFILSAEIIAITLATVAKEPLTTQVAVLTSIALLMTVGVYGLVAGIVKLDDAGLHLAKSASAAARAAGRAIVAVAPYLMKTISVVGTAAMFMVGGGILLHGTPGAEALIHHWTQGIGHVPVIGGVTEWLATAALAGIAGLIAGALALALVTGAKSLFRTKKA
jgi:predicted DNA repair protein MutK